MRLTTYKTMLDEEGKATLVKESSGNYSTVRDLSSPEDIVLMMNTVFEANRLAEECGWIIAINVKNRPIGVLEISHGSATDAFMGPREIFWRLCMCGAIRFFMVHNHPSFDPTPSTCDNTITERIAQCGKLMGIQLLDHIIIGGDTYYSYQEMGKIV